MNTKEQKIQQASKSIASEVFKMHDEMPSASKWNALCGQYLVYGFERLIGFSNAVQLESICETAWKQKRTQQEMESEIFNFLMNIGK